MAVPLTLEQARPDFISCLVGDWTFSIVEGPGPNQKMRWLRAGDRVEFEFTRVLLVDSDGERWVWWRVS
jgi:hypothetical protein